MLHLLSRELRKLRAPLAREFGKTDADPHFINRSANPKIGLDNPLLYRLDKRLVPWDDAQGPWVFDRNRGDLRKRRAGAIGLGLHAIEERGRCAAGADTGVFFSKPLLALFGLSFQF